MNPIAFNRNTKKWHVKIMYRKSVDKDIQSMLLPLNIMQTVCFCPKYHIKNNIIYPNSLLSNIISVCGALFFSSMFFYRVVMFYFSNFVRENMKFIFFVSHCDFWFYSFGYFLNCFLNIALRYENIDFVLTIQRSHRFLKNTKYLNLLALVNWLFILCICAAYILYVYYIYWTTSVLFFLLLFCFDANIIYVLRCITVLKDMLDVWNEEILRPQLRRDLDMKDYCQEMFQTYSDILKGYDTLKFTFNHFVSFHVLDFFAHALLYVQMIIESFTVTYTSGQDVFSRPLVAAIMWLVKSFLINVLFCANCEKFYISLENCQTSCALILKTSSSESQLKLSKNIQRLYRSSFKKMSACGLFNIDAALPLSLMSLITSYTVVLIQFALPE